MNNFRGEINNRDNGSKRIYGIEFLRIIFIFGIIIFHVGGAAVSPDLADKMHSLLNVKYCRLWFGVEYFFIIGGFFLYRSLQKGTFSSFERIKKLWWRLTPGMIFSFLLLAVIGRSSWPRFSSLLFEIQGLGIVPNPMGSGDWFIGAYFWTNAFLIALWERARKSFWIFIGVLCYLVFYIQYNGEPSLYTATAGKKEVIHYTFLGAGFARSISCVALGVLSAYLSEKIHLRKGFFIKILMTILEAALIYVIFSYWCGYSLLKYEILDVKLAFCLLLVSISSNYGLISTFFNKLNWIRHISKYTYSFLLGHIVVINTFYFYKKSLSLSQPERTIFVIGGGILLGVIEHHLIERFLVPKIRAYLSCDQGAKINGEANS